MFPVLFRKLWHMVSMAQDTVMLDMCFKFPWRMLNYVKTCCSNNFNKQSVTLEKLFSCQNLYILRMKSEPFLIISDDVSGDGVWWSDRADWVSLAHWESVVFSLARHKSWSIWTCSEWSWCVCWPALWPQTWQGCSRNFRNENKVKWECCSFDMKFSLNPFNLKQTHLQLWSKWEEKLSQD